MYKVILVDDEPMALEGLKYILDWNKLGFSLCEVCSNGKQTTDAINKHNPEVVITDVRMPIMDGLELIKYVRDQGREDIKFVVVSGYGEFEYAKKAMQYNVRYYLQKPILQEELYEIISEIKKQLDKADKNRENEELDKKAVLNCILGEFLRGNSSQETFEYLKSYLEEKAFNMDRKCIVVKLEASDKSNNNSNELKKIRMQIKEAVNKSVKDSSEFFIVEQDSNLYTIMISLTKEIPNKDAAAIIAESIYEALAPAVSCGFTVGVGESVEGIRNIKQSYDTARIALEHKFYNGLNCIIFYSDIKEKKFNIEFNDIFMSNKVLEAVEELDTKKIIDIIDNIYGYFQAHRIAPDIVVMFTSNMISKVSQLIHKSENVDDFLVDNCTLQQFKEHQRTMKELKKFFEDFCLGCCEHLRKMRNNEDKSTKAKLETFIKENFKRNITLRELAENLYMNPVYLGQLFTQNFQISFNEYVHKLRIEEAKKLMKETDLKNHEIAEKLGYCNYNSFLQQFQKYTGKKPKEFKSSVH